MIELVDITFSYREEGKTTPVLANLNVGFEKGDFVAVTGSSGCGKSTLLFIIGGLLTPDDGRVMLFDNDLYSLRPGDRTRKRAELIGFVFQRFHLLPYLTVRQNILSAGLSLPARVRHSEERIQQLMRKLQIQDRSDHLIGHLSVGEMQRTAVARAIFNAPEVILADEPTGNIDRDNAEIVTRAFSTHADSGGIVIMVTHSSEAAKVAHRTLLLKGGQLHS